MARGSARAEGCSSERAGVPLRLVSDPAEGRTSVAELVEGVGKRGRQGSAGGGGGGASPQAFGDPPRRRAPHQEVIGARASTGGGGGGAPHHRLLATPPGAGLLTRRLLGPGPAQEGGGGAPHHRLLATPPGAGLLTRRLLGPGPACARGPHHRLLAPRCQGGRAGGPSRLVPPGAGSVVHGHRPAEAVSNGAHVGSWPRAHGGGSQLSPPEVLAGCPWGAGHAVSSVLGGELPPMAKPRRPLRAGEPPQRGGGRAGEGARRERHGGEGGRGARGRQRREGSRGAALKPGVRRRGA